jgi:TonB family protein
METVSLSNSSYLLTADSRSELKSAIEKNTIIAHILSLGTMILLILVPGLIPNKVIDSFSHHPGTTELGAGFFVNKGLTPPVVYVSPVITEKIMTEFVAGKPIPIDSKELYTSMSEFANLNEISRSLSSTSGTLINLNELPDIERSIGTIEVKDKPEAMPDINEVSVVEINPGFDSDELIKAINYPKAALLAGISGKVIVRVLIDNTGKPVKSTVFYSDSEMLDREAVRAVMSITFTPAIQNGVSVPCWINIPVSFVRK